MKWIVDIEPHPTRYTQQWRDHLPLLLGAREIRGDDTTGSVTQGAFLDFAITNRYKGQQVSEMARLFNTGEIRSGDTILFTDAWHPGVLNCRYMRDLLGVKVNMVGLWHAGSYDPNDFLGRHMGDAPWVRHTEEAIWWALDHNCFATQYHIDLFLDSFPSIATAHHMGLKTCERVGWPMDYLKQEFEPYDQHILKGDDDVIVFPHRIAPEKQPDIFRDLQRSLPQYEFVMCQEQGLSKDQYHTLLARAKIMFSANLQETLGISAYEAAWFGAYPMVPNRCSYTEMGYPTYPTEWTQDWSAYITHKQELIEHIHHVMRMGKAQRHEHCDHMVKAAGPFFTSDALREIITP
jgi:hypothetical protein